MSEWVAFDAEMERQERQLHREREEAQQLAAALTQSASLEQLDAEGRAALFSLCDKVRVVPADVQIPVRTPRVSAQRGGAAFLEKVSGKAGLDRRQEGEVEGEIGLALQREVSGGGDYGGEVRCQGATCETKRVFLF